MNHTTIFDTETGSVAGHYHGTGEFDIRALLPGQIAVSGRWEPGAAVWKDGNVTEVEPAPEASVPVAEPVRTASDVNADRLAVLVQGFCEAGHRWRALPADLQALQQKVVGALSDLVEWPGAWRSADNDNVAMTLQEAAALVRAMDTFIQDVYQASWAEKESLTTTTT